MKKIFSVIIVVVLCFSFFACLQEKNGKQKVIKNIDNSVLSEVLPIDAFSEELTREFTEMYQKTDFRELYNINTDKITIFYGGVAPAYPGVEQYAINFYSVRNLEAVEIGYIGACLEETAWKLWGAYKTGIRPIIFSGYRYDDNKNAIHTCLYSFGFTENLVSGEYGTIASYNKFPEQTLSEIEVSAGQTLWAELGDESAVDTWQENERKTVFDNYIETRRHLNENSNNLSGSDFVTEDSLTASATIETNSSFESFVDGTWWDLFSQRCNLKMNVIDSETVKIEISWSSGAAYNTVWNFTGKWDADTGRLNYVDGIMLENEWIEGQQEPNILRNYTDGTGYFYFKNGYLYWVDNKENAGKDCYFEPPSELY